LYPWWYPDIDGRSCSVRYGKNLVALRFFLSL
jgi:hypothetical protein